MAQMNVVIVLSLLLIVTMGESRNAGSGNVKATALPDCNLVHGAQLGDSCFSVAQQFKLTAEDFGALNPNLVCDRIFVGQWLCVAGSA